MAPFDVDIRAKLPCYSEFWKGYNKGLDDFDTALQVDRIIYNPPATIVFWKNGEKTIVKCSENEEFSKYHGFCAALAKHVFGNNNQVTKTVNSGFEEKPVKNEKKNKSKGSKKK